MALSNCSFCFWVSASVATRSWSSLPASSQVSLISSSVQGILHLELSRYDIRMRGSSWDLCMIRRIELEKEFSFLCLSLLHSCLNIWWYSLTSTRKDLDLSSRLMYLALKVLKPSCKPGLVFLLGWQNMVMGTSSRAQTSSKWWWQKQFILLFFCLAFWWNFLCENLKAFLKNSFWHQSVRFFLALGLFWMAARMFLSCSDSCCSSTSVISPLLQALFSRISKLVEGAFGVLSSHSQEQDIISSLNYCPGANSQLQDRSYKSNKGVVLQIIQEQEIIMCKILALHIQFFGQCQTSKNFSPTQI